MNTKRKARDAARFASARHSSGFVYILIDRYMEEAYNVEVCSNLLHETRKTYPEGPTGSEFQYVFDCVKRER